VTTDGADAVRVVICDDSLGFPFLVTEWLRTDARFDPVGIVENGERLEALVAEAQPDAVVLDVVLPDVDDPGMLIARLRAIRPGVRVLMVSSHTEDVLARTARDAAADGHVNKAVTPGEFCDALYQAARPA
jgi:two-component system response regulator EvgA